MPEAYDQLLETMAALERHYRDMQDIEFTVEQGRLYLLQTRTAKRTAAAAIKCAVDMTAEGLIEREEAVARIDPSQLDQLLHPRLDPDAEFEVAAQGLNASPGAASGKIVLDADSAEERGKAGESVILVRWETTPDDIHGLIQAQGRPHRARRHDVARGRRRARHGQAVRRRLRGARDRHRRENGAASAGTSLRKAT